MRNPNENDKELQDADKNTTYLHVSNIALMRYSDNKDIPDFIEELKKIYKIESVLKNINFDNVMKKTHEKTIQTDHEFPIIIQNIINWKPWI